MTRLAIALLLSLPGYAATFAHDIAPIIYQNCAPCHRPGEAGPFSLLTYKDVKSHARQIADVTRRRYMPPWAPESGYGHFAGERRLTDTQIQLIAAWVIAGAPEGNPMSRRLRVSRKAGSSGRPT
jgi:mono/diheme cytochrome c family protein